MVKDIEDGEQNRYTINIAKKAGKVKVFESKKPSYRKHANKVKCTV